MAKILIFYSPFGSGHLSASRALAAGFEAVGQNTVIVDDIFNHVGSSLRSSVSNLYKRVSEKAPLLYEMYYEGTDQSDLFMAATSNPLTDALYTPFLLGLQSYLDETDPDAIVCTQQFPLSAVSFLKQQGKIRQPLYTVVTDFMVHASWIAPGVETYFVANELTAYVLEQRGVAPERIMATGIPVKLELIEPKTPEIARRQLKLLPNRAVLTLFGGGIEARRVRLMAEYLMSDSELPITLVVVAGRNEDLQHVLSDLSSNAHAELRNLGMIDYVDDLVAASDVVITKAGGLMVSEVLARGTPLIIIDPIPGQEEWNADFVAASGAGVQLRMPEMVPATVLSLLRSGERLGQMRVQARQVGRPHAALDVAEYILGRLRRSSASSL